jgi:tetratricopeptide (TPR) repeat protein
MELEDRITALRRVLQERLADAIARARTHSTAPKPTDRQREALRLNAAGARLRRAGAYDDAAEQHRQALTLFHDLGDEHSEALTLNNLALALDHAGDETALELFETAASTLSELGDEEHEGQVIANLALAFRRRGETEKSEDALDIALAKLRPESDAYRKVQSLKRAS